MWPSLMKAQRRLASALEAGVPSPRSQSTTGVGSALDGVTALRLP